MRGRGARSRTADKAAVRDQKPECRRGCAASCQLPGTSYQYGKRARRRVVDSEEWEGLKAKAKRRIPKCNTWEDRARVCAVEPTKAPV